MSDIAYYRVSTADQTIASQRHQLGDLKFEREFQDEGISGATMAAKRPGFASLVGYVREGDTVHVTAIDRLGRDSIDIQTTFRDHFKGKGVALVVAGLGRIEGEMGEFFLTMLAQMAQMERQRIAARTQAGRETARKALAETGRTHRGKASLGRPRAVDPAAIKSWREERNASIARTADWFQVSTTTVKRACREA